MEAKAVKLLSSRRAETKASFVAMVAHHGAAEPGLPLARPVAGFEVISA